jgi:hypothetical protein
MAAGVQLVPGRAMPKASMHVLMVLAVYIPAQVWRHAIIVGLDW